MKIFNWQAAAAASVMICLFISGCGSPAVESSTWLLAVGDDTLTVGQAGESWNGMDERQRSVFLSRENTVGEYIVTLGRKMLLQRELEEAGYLDNSVLTGMSESWFLERTGEQMRRLIQESSQEAVTPEQVDDMMGFLGESAFFTVDPGEEEEASYGPVHMLSLPEEMMYALDSIPMGSTGITETGMGLRLDSMQTADSALMAEMMADTAALRSNIATGIARRNADSEYRELRETLLSDFGLSVDSTALAELSAGYGDGSDFPEPERVILESDLGTWTVEDIMAELVYYRSRYSASDPSDPQWLSAILELVHYNEYSLSVLQEERPEVLDSLMEEKEAYLLDIASDQFYEDSIQSLVTVTEEDMRNLFENMEEPLTVPEKRVLQAVRMHRDSAAVFRQLPADEAEAFLSRRQGFATLAADPEEAPQVTRPLTVSEVPGFHGDEVFLMDPSDTVTWLGPLDLQGSDEICMFRLIQVIPERNATFDEVEDQIRVMTRNRLEEQATVEVMGALEQSYGMAINEDILQRLPENPGVWSQL